MILIVCLLVYFHADIAGTLLKFLRNEFFPHRSYIKMILIPLLYALQNQRSFTPLRTFEFLLSAVLSVCSVLTIDVCTFSEGFCCYPQV